MAHGRFFTGASYGSRYCCLRPRCCSPAHFRCVFWAPWWSLPLCRKSRDSGSLSPLADSPDKATHRPGSVASHSGNSRNETSPPRPRPPIVSYRENNALPGIPHRIFHAVTRIPSRHLTSPPPGRLSQSQNAPYSIPILYIWADRPSPQAPSRAASFNRFFPKQAQGSMPHLTAGVSERTLCVEQSRFAAALQVSCVNLSFVMS